MLVKCCVYKISRLADLIVTKLPLKEIHANLKTINWTQGLIVKVYMAI